MTHAMKKEIPARGSCHEIIADVITAASGYDNKRVPAP
jgi:hypothetical protein